MIPGTRPTPMDSGVRPTPKTQDQAYPSGPWYQASPCSLMTILVGPGARLAPAPVHRIQAHGLIQCQVSPVDPRSWVAPTVPGSKLAHGPGCRPATVDPVPGSPLCTQLPVLPRWFLVSVWPFRPRIQACTHRLRLQACPHGKEKAAERSFKEIITGNFPNMEREENIQIHKSQRTSNRLNVKRLSPRHIIIAPNKSKHL